MSRAQNNNKKTEWKKRAKEMETIKITKAIKRKRKENKKMIIKRRKAGEIIVQWH
jgi:hypothetical protein